MKFPDDFLQPDGSIQVELDFTIQSAKFCKDIGEDDEDKESGERAGKKMPGKKPARNEQN